MSRTKNTASNHYDVAVLGDSLAALLAATILVKKGCRALLIHDLRELPLNWLTSSLLLERVLDMLDGRSCCTKPFPFQVITRQQRIECHGKVALVDELRRELPNEHTDVATFLDDLQDLGEQLEELLWEVGGLPGKGIAQRFRFKKARFRSDVPGRAFRQTLRERLASFESPASRKFLTTLFTGFALAPSNKLTLAECALIWSGLGRQTGIVKNGLEELLWHRYRQFHGVEESLHRLARVKTGKDGSGKLLFEDDAVATADHLVFADRQAAGLCEGLPALPAARMTHRLSSRNLKARISPILARHVILDGKPPLRLQIDETETTARCRVETAALSDRGVTSAEQLEKRLEKIFPFVNLELENSDAAQAQSLDLYSESRSALLSGGDKTVFDRGRKYLCSGAAVVPELGSVGEVLVALTVANRILKNVGKPTL